MVEDEKVTASQNRYIDSIHMMRVVISGCQKHAVILRLAAIYKKGDHGGRTCFMHHFATLLYRTQKYT